MGWGLDEKFEYYKGSLKNSIFRGRVAHEKTIYRGKTPKKAGVGGGLVSLQI